MLLLPKYQKALEFHTCRACPNPINVGDDIIIYRFDKGKREEFKHRKCIDTKMRIGQKISVRKRRNVK